MRPVASLRTSRTGEGRDGAALLDQILRAVDDIIRGRQVAADMTPEKHFWGPTGVVIDNAGHVMVVESCRHRIQIYDRVEYDDV